MGWGLVKMTAERGQAGISCCGDVNAGFPSPARDYIEPDIDLHASLIRNPASTFIWRVKGHSMAPLIPDGAFILVDKSIHPVRSGLIVIAELDGELLLKRYIEDKDGISLEAVNPDWPSTRPGPQMPCTIWGVVTYIFVNAITVQHEGPGGLQ